VARSNAPQSSERVVNGLSGPLGYFVAIGAVAGATLVQWLVDPLIGDALIFCFYFAAVLLAVAYGGFWPGVIATLLSVAAADYFFISPRYSFYIETRDLGTWLGIATFVVVGITVAAINEALQRSRQASHSAARQLAVAVDNAQFLSEASKSVAALVDVESSMQRLAQLCVPRFADWCALYLVNEQSEIHPIARAHADPQMERLLAETISAYPPSWRVPTISSRVLRSGAPEFIPEISTAYLDSVTQDARHGQLIRALDPRSAIIVPLESRGRTIGMIQLVRGGARRAFTDDDYEVAQELARRAATAIDNSRLYDDLRAADRQKDDFLAMLAHELRNPLAAIDYATQLSSISPEQAANATEIIHRQVRQLARLIDDLLDVSRITRDKIELKKEPIDAATIVNRASGTARPIIEKHKHEFRVDVAEEEMPLFVDPTRVEQIIVNLLTNAAKYTPEEGQIALTAYPENEEVVINVRDTGVGIPKEMLPRVFELFTQVNPEIDRTKGGLGIGLTVVRRLTEKHGGTVSATSDGLGQGTEFTVRLPRSMGHTGTNVSGREGAQPPPGLRVLVVEDNVDTAAAMSKLLTQAGCDTNVAHDGPAALEAAGAFRPQVVLLDIGLPGIDGYEVARRLRADSRHRGLRLVAISGYGQAQDQQRSREAGFDHHLVKPVDYRALIKLLAK
jgi:K+-sensing histidine kinase KdpD/CheY-like chemotaxis protein